MVWSPVSLGPDDAVMGVLRVCGDPSAAAAFCLFLLDANHCLSSITEVPRAS